MNSWSYSGPYVTGVFSYDENCATEEHGDRGSESDADVSEGELGGEDDSDEDDGMDEVLDINEAALADSPYVQLSTG